MVTITIRECKTDGIVYGPTNHRTNDSAIAIERAIAKHWSKNHGFYEDSGLTNNPDTTRYGQIGHYCAAHNCSSMDTGRVRIDID